MGNNHAYESWTRVTKSKTPPELSETFWIIFTLCPSGVLPNGKSYYKIQSLSCVGLWKRCAAYEENYEWCEENVNSNPPYIYKSSKIMQM